MQRILDESLVAKSVAAQLDKKRNEYQNDVEKKEESLSKLNQELTKQQSVLSKEAFEQKMKDFNHKLSEVQREFQIKKNIIETSHMESMAKIQENMNFVLEQLAKEQALSMIFPANTLVFYKNHLDITSQTLALLDKRIQKIEINFKAVADKIENQSKAK